jgi:ABC-type branched-subunit amino acid transport system permease subunit
MYASLLRFCAPCIWSFLRSHRAKEFLRDHQKGENGRLDYIISVATVAGISIIMALSFYVPFMTGQISLAQAGFAAIGLRGSRAA